MKDNGIVIAIQGDLAQVRVECAQACQECSASSLCKGSAEKEGMISAQNPLDAAPGDEVLIEVPENRYNRALIGLFSGLLGGALIGTGAGYGLSGPLSLDPSLSGPLGFFVGLGLAIPGLILYFRKINQRFLSPSIIEIIQKGERHG